MKKLNLIVAVILLSATSIFAQQDATQDVGINIAPHAIVGISSQGAIDLSPDAPENFGESMDFSNATDNTTWLNYSSLVATGNTNTISCALENGDIPPGTTLSLSIGACVNGTGTTGDSVTSYSEVTPTGNVIVNNIGSCYTGAGSNQGHPISYKLEANSSSYADISADNYNAVVVFTITGN